MFRIFIVSMFIVSCIPAASQSLKHVQAKNTEILATLFNDNEKSDYLFLGIDAKPRTVSGKARLITLVNYRLKGDSTGQFSISYVNDSTTWFINDDGKDTASEHYSMGSLYKKLTREFQNGRIIKEIQYTNNSRNVHTTSFHYSTDGRLLRKEITMTNLKQPIEVRYDNSPTSVFEFRVDGPGKPKAMSLSETDKNNNILRRIIYSFEGHKTHSLFMHYDAASRLTELTDSFFMKNNSINKPGYQDTIITIRQFTYTKGRLVKQTQQNEFISWQQEEITETPVHISNEQNVDVVSEQPVKRYRYSRRSTTEKQPLYVTNYFYNHLGQETRRNYIHGSTEFIYSYDKKGNWITILAIIDKIPSHRLVRTIIE